MMSEFKNLVACLTVAGERFSGGMARDTAADWLDYFSADDAISWIDAGFWEPSTAFLLAEQGLSPADALRAAEVLTKDIHPDDLADHFTDGDPIYAVCNSDFPVAKFAAAAKAS